MPVLQLIDAIEGSVAAAMALAGRPMAGLVAATVLAVLAVLVAVARLAGTLPALWSLGGAVRRIEGKAGAEQGVYGTFAEVDRMLLAIPALAAGWEAYKGGLLVPEAGSSERIRSTVRPASCFGPGGRERSGAAGVFIGLGLLLGFVGLAGALQTAGQGRGGGTEALAALAILPAVAGLFGSLVVAMADWLASGRRRRLMDRLCTALDRALPYVAPQVVVAVEFDHLRRHLAEAENAAARSVADSMGDISDGLARAVKPLVKAIDGLRADLHGTTGEDMDGLVEALARLRQRLEAVTDTVTVAGQGLMERIDLAAGRVDRWAAEGERLHRRMTEGADFLASATATLHEALAHAGTGITERLANTSAAAEAVIRPLITQLGRFEGTLTALENTMSAGGQSFRDVVARLGDSAERMGEAAKALRGEGGTLAEAAGRLTVAAEGMVEAASGIATTRGDLAALAESVHEGGESLMAAWRTQGERLAEMDRDLARVFGGLMEGIGAYRDTVHHFLAAYRDNTARVTTTLDGQGIEMKKVIEELTQMMERRS